MNIVIDKSIVDGYASALQLALAELKKCQNREEELKDEVEKKRLLNEQQAQEYLQRDQETIRYYRTMLGLPSIKIGRYRWYVKGEIDAWLEAGKVNRHDRK